MVIVRYFAHTMDMNQHDRDVLQSLGAKIRDWRKQKKLTQRELAYEANIPRAHLSKIENGQISFSILTLIKIAYGLEVTISELFRGSPRAKRKQP